MSVLSRKSICAARDAGDIHIHPFEEKYLDTDSLDVRLGRKLWPIRKQDEPIVLAGLVKITPAQWPEAEVINLSHASYVLRPGKRVRALTLEYITLSGIIAARFSGRSIFAQQGLYICGDSNHIHAGSCGHQVFELHNDSENTFVLTMGLLIAQIIFERCE